MSETENEYKNKIFRTRFCINCGTRLDARRNSRKNPDSNTCTCGVILTILFAKDSVGILKIEKVK